MPTRTAHAPASGPTHIDRAGRARMVDVADKPATRREAVAVARLRMRPSTLRLALGGRAPKGDVLACARIAAIQAAKRTPEIIPLCHGIALGAVEVYFAADRLRGILSIETRARAVDRTGVEMEALVAASVAALTVYDMLKAVDRGMVIERVQVREKRGGKSDFVRGRVAGGSGDRRPGGSGAPSGSAAPRPRAGTRRRPGRVRARRTG
jgi:cyclic pyranopterin phosphate synthase